MQRGVALESKRAFIYSWNTQKNELKHHRINMPELKQLNSIPANQTKRKHGKYFPAPIHNGNF